MKRLQLLLLTLLTAFVVVGCGTKDTDTQSNGDAGNQVESNGAQDSSDEGETDEITPTEGEEAVVTIEHSKGVTEVPVGAKKAVVFDLSILDTIHALDLDVELGLPSGLPSYLESYSETATVVGSMKEADLEAIFTFEPDVIFISGRLADYYDELNKIAPTVYVDLNAETYLDDVKKNAGYVAEIFGNEEKAEELLVALDQKVEEVATLASASEEKALIVLTNEGNMSVYGSGSRFGIIHDLLGVKPADETIEVSTHGQEASYEYISEINPDILYVVDRTAAVGGTVLAGETLNNDLVNGTNAAVNGKIIYLDSEIWYLSGGGLNSTMKMIEDVAKAFQ